MEPGVTVKVYGLEDVRKQTEAVREKMRELNQELGKLERTLCIEVEINQPPEDTTSKAAPCAGAGCPGVQDSKEAGAAPQAH